MRPGARSACWRNRAGNVRTQCVTRPEEESLRSGGVYATSKVSQRVLKSAHDTVHLRPGAPILGTVGEKERATKESPSDACEAYSYRVLRER